MCGRIEYVVTSRKQLEDHYGATLIEGYTDEGITQPRYNISPSAITPIVTSERPDEIVFGYWGYLPNWARDKERAREVINARAETVLEKPYFKSAIVSRRCLIPVTGFFEWKREGSRKTPYRFYINDDIFSLAGLYSSIADEEGKELPHYAIITTTANELMATVHNRMPVIIDRNAEREWLSEKLSEADIQIMLKPYPAARMQCYEIAPYVNNPRNNTPAIIKPIRVGVSM